MKKKLKILGISLACCMFMSVPFNSFAGFWFLTYCKSAPLETYEASYSETLTVFGVEVTGNGTITTELDC